MICEEDHYTKYFPHCEEVAKFMKGTSQPVVLTNPFPIQQQQMVAQNHVPPQGGNAVHPHHKDASLSAQVLMCNGPISLMTRANTYDIDLDNHANGGATNNPSTSTPPPSSAPLQIEMPSVDSVFHPPKGTIQKLTFNPSAHVVKNYNVVENLA
jgi:hypothetical protein